MVSTAAAMSLGVKTLPRGTAATIVGSGSPVTSIALDSNSSWSLAQAASAISCSPLHDNRRPAKPAIVALRAAWRAGELRLGSDAGSEPAGDEAPPATERRR